MISRRTFAQAFALSAVTVKAADSAPHHVIDVATHFYDTARPQGVPWPSPKEPLLYKPTFPGRYLSAIKPYRVDGVIAIEASPWLEDNLWLLMLGDRAPLIRGVVGNIPPGHPDFKGALERFAKHPLFRGIRVGAASVPRFLNNAEQMADLRQLMERNLSLDILVGPPLFEEIARLSTALPDLRIIVGHLPLDLQPGIRECGKREKICAKVSGVVRRVNGQVPVDAAFYKPGLDELWSTFGPDRVLYASNWPASDMIAPYPVVYSVISDYLSARRGDESEKFFWKNALETYRIPLLRPETARN